MKIDLYEELDSIISRYNVDSVFELNEEFVTLDLLEKAVWDNFINSLSRGNDIEVSLYGFGRWGKYVFEKLSLYPWIHVKYIIDNYAQLNNENINIIPFSEWLYKERTEVVLITVLDPKTADAIHSQLYLEGYKHRVIRVQTWIEKEYEDLQRPFFDYRDGKFSYLDINYFLLDFQKKKKYGDLRKLLYGLFSIKDFMSAEYYIEEVKQYSVQDYSLYMEAMRKVKTLLREFANDKYKEVIFVNIIDSLPQFALEQMPFLKLYAEKNLNFTNIINQYPYTSFAIKSLFTGSTALDISLKDIQINRTNSLLLQYAEKSGRSVYYVAPIPKISNLFSEANNDINVDESCFYQPLSEILFRGLHLALNGNKNEIIFLHSLYEIHSPCWHIGSRNVESWADFKVNYEESIQYVDRVLQWYYAFIDKMGCSIITMGDHGGSAEHLYEILYVGEKKDFPICDSETINPVCVIKSDEMIQKKIEGLIRNTELSKIVLYTCQHSLREYMSEILNMQREFIEFHQIPGYSQDFCERHIPNKCWGIYEGAIGIKTSEELFFKYVTGRECYFRPHEQRYRNLIDDTEYMENIEYCRTLLHNRDFPVSVYMKEKYRKHLELLKIYNTEEYETISKKIEEL